MPPETATKPSVGRVVHFHVEKQVNKDIETPEVPELKDDEGNVTQEFQPAKFKENPVRFERAALITAVNEDGTVALSVFNPGGGIGSPESVKQGSGVGEWDWPAKV